MPSVEPSGTTLQIESQYNQDSVIVSIDATTGVFDGNDSPVLIASSNGVMYLGKEMSLKNKTIKIPKQLFPSGIVRFSLLKQDIPLNERIVFINHYDNLKINVEPDLESDKDSVRFKIQVKDAVGKPVTATLSLSITDNSVVGADTSGNFDIGTSLLLNAELKGEVENPGYYFSENAQQASLSLDHLMLTQGWVGYKWEDVFKLPILKVQAERQDNVLIVKQIYFDNS
ncbi:MAG: hypothetical protein EOP04_30420, partial [Proteobacteria bacterium]